MSIWNKILVGLICVAAIPYFYLAARALKMSTNWHEKAVKYEARLEQLREENERLLSGYEKEDGTVVAGIRQYRNELYRLLLDRRRVWLNCDPKIKLGREDGTAEITLTIGSPTPHEIAEKTVVYAFEDIDVRQKGRYMGQYIVSEVPDEKQIVLVPTGILSPRQVENLASAKRPWILYELMPRDDHEVFATLSDEQLRAMLPASTVQEYLKDGKPASPEDPAQRIVEGKFVRPLREYTVLLTGEYEKRILLNDALEAVKRDKKLVMDALAAARAQEEACKRDIAAEKKQLAEQERQRDIVASYRKKLQEKLDAMQAAVKGLIARNQAMAGQIAAYQLEAARRIEQRARRMAGAPVGRP